MATGDLLGLAPPSLNTEDLRTLVRVTSLMAWLLFLTTDSIQSPHAGPGIQYPE